MCFPDFFDLLFDLFLVFSPGTIGISLINGLSSLLIERDKAIWVNGIGLLRRKIDHLIIVNCLRTNLQQFPRTALLHGFLRLLVGSDICAKIEVSLPQLLSVLLPLHFGSGNSAHGLLTEIFAVQTFVNGYCRSIRELLLPSSVYSLDLIFLVWTIELPISSVLICVC